MIVESKFIIIFILICIFLIYFYYENNKIVNKVETFTDTDTNKNNKELIDFFDIINKIYKIDETINNININLINIYIKNKFIFKSVIEDSSIIKLYETIISNINDKILLIDKLLRYSNNSIFGPFKKNYKEEKKIIDNYKIFFSKLSKNNSMKYYIDLNEIRELYINNDDKLIEKMNNIEKHYKTINSNNTRYFNNIKKNNKNFLDKIDKIKDNKNIIDLSILFQNYDKIIKNTILNNNIFNLISLLFTTYNLYNPSNDFVEEQQTNFNDYENLKNLTQNLISENIAINNNLSKNVSNNQNVILNNNLEFKFLNTAGKNNNILLDFCNKMNMLNKPSENNLIFRRFSKEFIDKKYKHIQKLQKEIDTLQQNLYKNEMSDYNAYKLRTHLDAKKQYNAIKLAKNNIENKNKLKLNIT
jgi:hypothetical protein